MITTYYKVFNEVDFLKESLESVYPYTDKIVILEYCLESMRKIVLDNRVTDRGLSTDGTTELINNFPDPLHKIDYRPLGFVWGGENLIYQYMIDDIDVGDYMWVIDGDIVYRPEFANQIYEWCLEDKYDVIWVCEPVFWHDLYHTCGNFPTYHQRVLKKQTTATFYWPGLFEAKWVWDPGWRIAFYERNAYTTNDPRDFRWNNPDGKYYEDKPYRPKMCSLEKGEYAYHYAYVRTVQRILEKLLWQYDMIDRKWNNVAARNHCSTFKDPLDFKINTLQWITAQDPAESALWTKGQPDVMKNNKWIDYHWDEKPINITYEEARKLVKWVGEC
jgi:hypothetical protein